MSRLGRALVVAALAAGSFVVPVRRTVGPAGMSPRQAAVRAEATVPSVGLIWGKLRGWERRVEGWALVWQPAHGAWTVKTLVPDDTGPVRHELEVTPWLSGARLSRDAARLVAGVSEDSGVPIERLGRRDWDFGAIRLLGAVHAGPGAGSRARVAPDPWLAVIVGLVVAGAVARSVLPGLASRGWRRAVIAASGVLLVLLPWLVPVGARFFRVGVRPWVTEITIVTSMALLLGGVIVGAARFPMMSGRLTSWWVTPSALAVGWLAGLAWPMPMVAEIAGSAVALPALAALVVLVAWACCLAADGLREVASLAGRWRDIVLAILAAAAVAMPGPAAPPLVGACLAASRGRGEGAWISSAVAWGWVAASSAVSCAWSGAVRDAALLALAAWTVVAVNVVPSGREPVEARGS